MLKKIAINIYRKKIECLLLQLKISIIVRIYLKSLSGFIYFK